MRDAGQCVIELDGSIRTHFHLPFAFLIDSMPWTMSKRSAHSLNSPEDEICDLFRLGCFHAEIFANLFDILDGLNGINVAVVAYHRDDVSSVTFGLSIAVAADAVDLLDEVHVLLLCMRSFTLECRMPVIVESCLEPEYLNSMRSLVFRNEVEVRIDIKDGCIPCSIRAQTSGILSFRMVLGARIPSEG